MKNKTIFLSFILICFMFSLASCTGKHTIKYYINEHDFEGEIKVKENVSYTIEVKELDYYYFIGYYDEDGARYTNDKGESLFPYDLEEDLTLYAKYAPCEYSITMDLSEADNKDEFLDTDTTLSFNSDMPQLPLLTKEKHDLICYEAIIGEESIIISEENNYLEGFEKLTDEYLFDNKNGNVSITIKPIFDKKKHQMTFTYLKDGKSVTETLKVYIETDIKDAAPKYTDEFGNQHDYAWRTIEQKDSSNPYVFYQGQTQEGLALYADYFYKQHNIPNNTTTPFLIETYSFNVSEKTLHLANLSSINANIKIDIDKNTDDYLITLNGGSSYNGLTFDVLQRDSDLMMTFATNSKNGLSTITPIEKHDIIDATKLDDNQLLTLTIKGIVQFSGLNGVNGAHGKDESGGSAVGGSADLPPAESGKHGTDGTGCISATNLKIVVPVESKFFVYSGNGGHGGNGGIPRPTDQKNTGWGADGGCGGSGGNGQNAIETTYLIIDVLGTMNVTAGNGGNGGAGGRGSYAVGGTFHDVDCAGDGGDGGNGGMGGFCFSTKGYEVINYAKGTLKAGSAGHGGNGGNGGDAGYSSLYGEGPGGRGANGGNAGAQGDIGLKESLGDHLTYIGSFTRNGGKRGANGYNGDGTNDHLGSDFTRDGTGSQGRLFGGKWNEQ